MIMPHAKFTMYLLPETALIKDALTLMDKNDGKIAIVVDAGQKIIGTITDGDVRRGLLDGCDAKSPAINIMNKNPFFIHDTDDRSHIFQTMRARKIRHIPIVNKDKKVIDIISMDEMLTPIEKDNWVVIMAGGLGKRLHPLTETTPKPMLQVAGTPVVEHLVTRFIAQGFRRFYLSINYLGHQIKDHFGDGSSLGVEIRYVEENAPLSTAGSLSLLPHRPKEAFIVINGDIITNVNFADMLDFHHSADVQATMGVREYNMDIPYGVVELDEGKIIGFKEKPRKSFFVNTGIYVLEPTMLDMIKNTQPLSMPELLLSAQEQENKSVSAFPVREHWLDIGRIEDFSRAESLIQEIAVEESARA